VTIGFIGFGEGSTIAGGLAESGVDRIAAFDIAAADAERGPRIQQRAARTGTILLEIGRVVTHGARRAREMEEVADTLRAIGVEPIMAEATARRQDWSAEPNLRAHFGPDRPRTAADVTAVVARLTGAHEGSTA
jgi:Domain of unknown function (DUF1932)